MSFKAGRYYVSVLVEIEESIVFLSTGPGLGIDLGVKDFAMVNTMEQPFKNINKTKKIKALEEKLMREQRNLSRKYESLKLRKKEKGEATWQNNQKQIVVVQKVH